LEVNDYLCGAWCLVMCQTYSYYVYNHNHDKEHADVIDGMGRPLV
jgi:hypothetical protein